LSNTIAILSNLDFGFNSFHVLYSPVNIFLIELYKIVESGFFKFIINAKASYAIIVVFGTILLPIKPFSSLLDNFLVVTIALTESLKKRSKRSFSGRYFAFIFAYLYKLSKVYISVSKRSLNDSSQAILIFPRVVVS
jgi:hypothetical protein